MRALLLPVGHDLYAVDMQVAREVVAAPEIQALPTSPGTVVGVFNLRGEIVPVFDTSMLLGLGRGDGSVPFACVVQTPLGPAALVMTAIGTAAELDEPVGATETPGTLATYAVGDALVVLIDLDALLTPARIDT